MYIFLSHLQGETARDPGMGLKISTKGLYSRNLHLVSARWIYAASINESSAALRTKQNSNLLGYEEPHPTERRAGVPTSVKEEEAPESWSLQLLTRERCSQWRQLQF